MPSSQAAGCDFGAGKGYLKMFVCVSISSFQITPVGFRCGLRIVEMATPEEISHFELTCVEILEEENCWFA